MISARRVGRWAVFALGGCVGLVVLARIGLAIYLATSVGRAMVARQIESRIGMPVEVQSVRIGLRTSSITMRVLDPGASEPSNAELFAVESASADVSMFGLLFGRFAPTDVDLKGANLTLHVSADGKVLTTLPKTQGGAEHPALLPAIHLTDGRITIRQDGRPEFALRNLDLAVEPGPNGEVKLSGNIDDPDWAKWSVTGDIQRESRTGWVELATGDGPLTMDRLGSVPFVPPIVWESVLANGRGAVNLRLWTSSAGIEYAVDIKPAKAALTLPQASVTLANLTGDIRVSGAKVDLADCRAELAGGTLAVSGAIDFGTDPTTATVNVTAAGLDIRALPPEWGMPKDFEGKLKGHAELALKILPDGRVEPDGGGEGTLTEVKVLGFPGDDIPIHLRKAGNRYQFRQSPPVPKKTVGGRFITRELIAHATRQEKKQPKPDEPTTLEATVRFHDIEVAELLDKLKVNLGYKISGKLSVEASVSVPVARVTNTATYQFSGKMSSPALKFEGLTVRDLSAKMMYHDGKLTLSELSGKIDQPDKSAVEPGNFRGTATAAIDPPGEAVASFKFDGIPLGELLKAIPNFTLRAQGTVSGQASLKAPYEKLWDTNGWNGSAELNSSELVVEERSIKNVRFVGSAAKGKFALTEARATVEGIPLTAEASLGLTDKYPYTATVSTRGTDIADLRKLVPELRLQAPIKGVLETETKVTGTASPFAFSASGTVTASKLTLAKSPANHIAVKWEATTEKLVVSELKADVFGGSLTGSLDYPFALEKRGNFEMAFKNLDAAAASELVPDFPVQIAGQVSGKVNGAIEPAKPGQSRVGNLDLNITAPRLTVQGIPAERLVGKAAIKSGVFEYQLEGKTLGGSFEVKGRYPGGKKMEMPVERGSLKITGIDLARLAPDLRLGALTPLSGHLDVTFNFENDFSAGSGRVVLSSLRWGNESIARDLVGVLMLRDGLLELTDVAGGIAGGSLRARAQIRLSDTSHNSFSIFIEGADAKRLLAPIPEVAGRIDGPMTVVVRGKLGKESRLNGTISLPRGTISGATVTDLLVPFELATARGGYGRLMVQEASMQAGSGRATANLTVDWGVETRVDGVVRFINLPLRAVVPDLGGTNLFGSGRITGRFDITGSGVRSADDLTGTLLATLNQTSVKEIPIIRLVTPFLNPSGLVKPFEAGDVRATLKAGVFRIERLALSNPTAQVFADGSITTSGRVELNVVGHTGLIGPEVRGLQLLGLRLPLVGPAPLSLIADVSDFLSNRTVRLTITGSTSNPIVRVNVGALLTEEAVRFFLSRYILPGDVSIALGLSPTFGSTQKK